MMTFVDLSCDRAPERPFVDLFCGAGGAGLGLVRAGLTPLVGYDIHPRAVEIYRRAVGLALRADVRDLDPRREILDRPFLLWASPPCPPWSEGRLYRGLPMGFETEEGRLLREPLRWAEALRPVWVAIENVGTLPAEVAGEIVESLQALGYQTRILRLNARAWVPQNRDHLFIVGGPAPMPDPTPPVFAPRFADIRDGQGAIPVPPRAIRHWVRKKWSVPIVDDDGVLPTVSTRPYHVRWTCAVYEGDGRYRFPTFREALRAQGFPDNHPLVALHAEAPTTAWTLLGNAVPVPLVEAIGRAILATVGENARAGSRGGVAHG